MSLLPGNYLFYQASGGVDAWKEQQIHQIAGKTILNKVGERGKKEKLLNWDCCNGLRVSADLSALRE